MNSFSVQLDMSDIQFILVVGCVCFLILQFIIIICLAVSLSKTRKRVEAFLPSNKDLDIEGMLVEYNQNSKEILEREQNMLELIKNTKEELKAGIEASNKLIYLTNEKLKNAVQKVSIIRYNPFEEVGGDLCYAIALLDEQNNGIVINSIYSREACYSYAKQIINGESPMHKLSEEEKQAIEQAMNK